MWDKELYKEKVKDLGLEKDLDCYVRIADVYIMLHNIGGCGAEEDSWADGWDKAIDEAIRQLDDLPMYQKEEDMKDVG